VTFDCVKLDGSTIQQGGIDLGVEIDRRGLVSVRTGKLNVCRVSVGCGRLTYRDHVGGDPSFDIPLRCGVHLLFRKDYTLMYPHLVLMPLEHVSTTGYVSDTTEVVLTASWLISLRPCSLGPIL